MKRVLLIMIVLLTSGAYVQGQVKPKPKAPPKPVTTQSATTEDGKKVVLRSDGTWLYDTTTSSATPTPPVPKETPKPTVENASLSFDTGLVLKSGDVKPVARARRFIFWIPT